MRKQPPSDLDAEIQAAVEAILARHGLKSRTPPKVIHRPPANDNVIPFPKSGSRHRSHRGNRRMPPPPSDPSNLRDPNNVTLILERLLNDIEEGFVAPNAIIVIASEIGVPNGMTSTYTSGVNRMEIAGMLADTQHDVLCGAVRGVDDLDNIPPDGAA